MLPLLIMFGFLVVDAAIVVEKGEAVIRTKKKHFWGRWLLPLLALYVPNCVHGAAGQEFLGGTESLPSSSVTASAAYESFEEDASFDRLSYRNEDASTFTRLKRAELLSVSAQVLGMGMLQAADAWHTGHRPFSDARDNLGRAWTSAPKWDDDSYFYNYIGHPYTGSFTYNLMRSQKASALTSWLFSCSQSLIWEFTFEAAEQHPSIQDLLITSNMGSLMGEGIHRLTGRMRKNGLSRKEKVLLLILNPGHVLNNGFR